MRFSLPPVKCSAAPSSLLLLSSTASLSDLNCAQRFDYRALGSSRKLGEATEHLIGGNEKRFCRPSFEF